MARHDRLRTSTADGTSDIDQPAASWRTYLGGSLGREQYLTFDIDSDGNPEILFLMGGAPFICITIGMIAFSRFKLTGAAHAQIRAALDARARGEVEPEVNL